MPSSRRRVAPPTRRDSAAGEGTYVREQYAALRYTERWHRVRAWAERAVSLPGFDVFELAKRGERSAGFQAWCVASRRDAEEAFERGVALEDLGNFSAGPRRGPGGTRRVIITAYTWKSDESGEVGYDPRWITLGWGMTAHEATAAAHRFVRDSYDPDRYQLLVTGVEVKFWTQSAAADDA